MKEILSAFDAPALDWRNLKSISNEKIEILPIGCKSYLEVRDLQNDLVQKRKNNLARDIIILTEHPPTLTLGKRLRLKDYDFSQWQKRGVEVFETDRGGEITFHAPGQLIIYPVMNLRARQLGVESLVESFLSIISSSLKQVEIEAECRLRPAGLWVGEAKIASVGLRIDRGVTNHGFSLNLSCSTKPFLLFPVCGQESAKITSVLDILGDAKMSDLLIKHLIALFLKFDCMKCRYQ